MLKFLKKILFYSKCAMCGEKESKIGVLCLECNKRLDLMSELKQRKNIYYLYYYSDVRRVIADLKFKNRKEVISTFSKHIRKAINEIVKKEKIDCIVSTPTSRKHILTRGFNQVDELLKEAKINFSSIKKIRATEYMFKIKGLENRKKNIKDAFLLERSYKNKKVLLVDDIITTGATLETLKKLLLEKGEAKEVIFFCMAAAKGYFK